MGLLNIPASFRALERFTTQNSPTLLSAFGVVGLLSTAFLTGVATVQAVRTVDAEAEAFLYNPTVHGPLHKKWVVKKVWKLYIPPISVAAVTITSIVLANRIGTRRAMAVAAAYSLSEKAFEEYREKVKQKLTPKKEAELRDELAQERTDRLNSNQVNVVLSEGADVPVLDEYSNRVFTSMMETLKKAQNDLNFKLIRHDRASLNEFYDELRLAHVAYGENVGWTATKPLDLKITSVVLPNGRPALAIDFYTKPFKEYLDLH